MFDFNSHAHVERDSALALIGSILGYDFNSHAHVERDAEFFNATLNGNKFQLTRSRGA